MNFSDPFNRCTGPVRKDLDLLKREDRIVMIGEWAAAVVGDLPRDHESEYFIAQAILAWLRSKSGRLTRDHLKTSAEAGSTQSEPRVWQRLKEPSSRGQTIGTASAKMEPLTNPEDQEKCAMKFPADWPPDT